MRRELLQDENQNVLDGGIGLTHRTLVRYVAVSGWKIVKKKLS